MKKLILPSLAILAAASVPLRAATIVDKIHDITVNTTQTYVFTEAGVGSITLQAVFATTLNGAPAGGFTSLDSGIHVGNSASGGGSHFIANGTSGGTVEGFNVTISLLSATSGVDITSIQFSFESLGVRVLNFATPTPFSWTSSATVGTVTTSAGTSEQLWTLDSSFYSGIATTPYTGSWSRVWDGGGEDYIQLSDSVAGGNGLQMSATFVPEPSVALLGGLGCLLFLRRRV
jgi:hypothetical protein